MNDHAAPQPAGRAGEAAWPRPAPLVRSAAAARRRPNALARDAAAVGWRLKVTQREPVMPYANDVELGLSTYEEAGGGTPHEAWLGPPDARVRFAAGRRRGARGAGRRSRPGAPAPSALSRRPSRRSARP